ncbi:hypothetical protein UMM65_06385 [Aureibaculum sp. 2210JD6-5]|uniref:hypothetical protein n=1 Tax=Aureibaculum sp. 2210JD6-5 TaxID=3103957 RepID=UPI002AAC4F8F|nr:hypothetical protein [Aureibaculum sp. 2210JD6-5]MDY7394862.1 hypothetical protein [Aureibaculum sp. 2210JD6-5]
MNTPFKTKGIYVIKLNPEKDLVNYKPTKLGRIWNVITNQKHKDFYRVLKFVKKFDYENPDLYVDEYSADLYTIMTENIYDLASWEKYRDYNYAKYKRVEYDIEYFQFGDKGDFFHGNIREDFLYLNVTHEDSNEFFNYKFIYIHWN